MHCQIMDFMYYMDGSPVETIDPDGFLSSSRLPA